MMAACSSSLRGVVVVGAVVVGAVLVVVVDGSVDAVAASSPSSSVIRACQRVYFYPGAAPRHEHQT